MSGLEGKTPDAAPAADFSRLEAIAPGSDRLSRILVQGVTDYAIFLLDPQGRVTSWNPGAECINGYTPEEIIGSHISRFYTEEDRAAGLPEQALRAVAKHGRFEHEGWRVRKDGSRFWANVAIEAIRNDNGGLIAFAEIARDMTERVGALTALRESEERFRMLVHGVTDYAIYMLDPEGNITNWNLGGERIKGYAADEVVGKHFSIFYTAEDRARGEPQRGLEIARREGRYEREGWRVRKDGTRFWANAVIDAIYDPNGKLLGFAKVTRDMTEQQRAAEALEETRAALAQSQKMEAVGQLTGGVAHDFNNLLTVITNALDLLAGSSRDEAQRRRIIDSAQRAAERGAKLTQQLLAFSRQTPLRPEVHDINRVIIGFEAVLRRAAGEAIAFELELPRRPLPTKLDASQFETAMLNLAVNARDAMPRGGRLRITAAIETVEGPRARAMADLRPGNYVVVSVADTGEGMTPETQRRAVEPFFTTKEVGKGSGLGLSQVYGFVVQSGGYIEIDSTVGAGTTVKMYLPVAGTAELRAAETAPRGHLQAIQARILLVEDDPEVLDIAVAALRRLGYEVATAPDGPSALAILKRDDSIAVLFTDIVMPRGMNGVELAREAVRFRPQLRVLLASGYPKSALSSEHGVDDAGDFAFIGKPYRGADLAAKLRELQTA